MTAAALVIVALVAAQLACECVFFALGIVRARRIRRWRP